VLQHVVLWPVGNNKALTSFIHCATELLAHNINSPRGYRYGQIAGISLDLGDGTRVVVPSPVRVHQ
jgi:hypothetical protein